MAVSLFRLEAIEFQRRRAWVGAPTAPPLGTWLLTAFFVAAVACAAAFLALGSYSRKETVSGYLTPVGGIAKVLPTAPGVVADLYVADGDTVAAGQRLLLVRSERFGAEGQAVDSAIIDRLQARRDALTDRIKIEQTSAAEQKQSLVDALAGLEADVGTMADAMRIARERLAVAHAQVEAVRSTVATGLTSMTEFRQRQDAELAQQQTLSDLYRQTAGKVVDAQEKRHALAELESKTADNLAVLRAAVDDAAAALAEARGKQGYVVAAPVAGRITNLQAWIGMHVETALPFLSIVPAQTELEVALMVPARAIGFVSVGQGVRFAFDPFPSQRFGTYGGTVVAIADTLLKPAESVCPVFKPCYRVVARLDRQTVTAYGAEVALRPEMSLKANIVLDRRNLIAWLFDPLLSARGRS